MLPQLIALLLLQSAAPAEAPRTYECKRTETPPRLDGSLDDPRWQSAPWSTDFLDIQGTAFPKPRYRTRFKMLWDDRFLYFGAELQEPDVWATLTQHDSVIFHDNDFEVFIDPNGDTLEYFEFEINALNTSWDLFLPKPYRAGGKADNSWEIPGLRTAVKVKGTLNHPGDRDQGWSVVMAFPWAAFGERARMPLPPHPGDTWRMNFSRVEWRSRPDARLKTEKEDNWVWSPQGVIDMHRPERWGYVRFASAK